MSLGSTCGVAGLGATGGVETVAAGVTEAAATASDACLEDVLRFEEWDADSLPAIICNVSIYIFNKASFYMQRNYFSMAGLREIIITKELHITTALNGMSVILWHVVFMWEESQSGTVCYYFCTTNEHKYGYADKGA